MDHGVNLEYAFYNTPCSSTSCGVVQGQFKTEDGRCESTPAPTTTQQPSVAPSTFAPTPKPLPYEYAPTVDAMPYCRLSDSSVCWGNTHRFLAVTANGPFDGVDVGWGSAPALGDLDGNGTLSPRPSIHKL